MTGNGSGNRRPNATDLDAVRELYLTAEWVPCAMHVPAMADELEALRARWFGLRAHITRIAYAGARNDERQKVFEELRDIIVRLEGAE